MPPRSLIAVVALASSVLVAAQQPAASSLRIVVISGEGGVNIIQQKTAVAPIVEIRDRNNLPVAGASVTFSVSGSGATFGSGSTLTVVTNAAGQATAAGLTPTTAGAIQLNVSAAFQGQTVAATIAQTNFATAAQAAQAAAASSGGASSGATGAATGGAAGGGGGIGLTTIGIIGAAAAGGAVAATKTDLFGKNDAFVTMRGQVFATATFGAQSAQCSGVRGEGNTSMTCYLNPVGGATVSTSLDSATATTDGGGNFELVTATLEKDAHCRTYTLTITAAAQPRYSISVTGFASSNSSSRTLFSMSPPAPESMSAPCP